MPRHRHSELVLATREQEVKDRCYQTLAMSILQYDRHAGWRGLLGFWSLRHAVVRMQCQKLIVLVPCARPPDATHSHAAVCACAGWGMRSAVCRNTLPDRTPAAGHREQRALRCGEHAHRPACKRPEARASRSLAIYLTYRIAATGDQACSVCRECWNKVSLVENHASCHRCH